MAESGEQVRGGEVETAARGIMPAAHTTHLHHFTPPSLLVRLLQIAGEFSPWPVAGLIGRFTTRSGGGSSPRVVRVAVVR